MGQQGLLAPRVRKDHRAILVLRVIQELALQEQQAHKGQLAHRATQGLG